MTVEATIWWMSDNVPPNLLTEPFNFQENGHVDSRDLILEVWLDAPVQFDASGKLASAGNLVTTRAPNNPDAVIGGEWRSGYSNDAWPDYMWVPHTVMPVYTPESVPGEPNEEPYRNPHIDPEWMNTYLFKGQMDPGAQPINIAGTRSVARRGPRLRASDAPAGDQPENRAATPAPSGIAIQPGILNLADSPRAMHRK